MSLYAEEEGPTAQKLVGDNFGPVVQKTPEGGEVVVPPKMPVIEIKGDWIYVDGEKFLVKGVGYSGWRPHELPWQTRPKGDLIDHDFKLISEAGFNAVRTWTPLNDSELALARKYGLMVMQGIFVDPTRDYASPVYQNYVVSTVKNQVRYYLKTPNILMFLVANEPPVERVATSGVSNTEKVLSLMIETVKKLDPKKIVTFANWVPLAFLDHSFLPVIGFNVYMYEPHLITHALTYKGYVEWLKKNLAPDKPLLIVEFGLSVSAYGPGKMGRGGNSEEEQRDGVLMMWDDIINAGATGGCVFEWNDEWWKNYDYSGDQYTHDTSDPEEWYGVIEIKDDTSDHKGRPRLVYQALKSWNQAIVVNPKNIEFYSGKVPIEVYTTDKVNELFYRLNSGTWMAMKKTGQYWWQLEWDSKSGNDGKQLLEVKALDLAGNILCTKKRTFWTNNKSGFEQPVIKVSLATDRQKYVIGDKMEKLLLTIKVTDKNNKPVPDQIVDYAFYECRFWQSLHGTKTTDEKGSIEVEYYVNETGFINIAAGTTLKVGDYSRRYGDLMVVEVEKLDQESYYKTEDEKKAEAATAEKSVQEQEEE